MDKRDFYRELMEQYAFDKDKIYINAKKGKTGWKSLHKQPLRIYIGMTAAVATVVVTVGTITATHFGRPQVVDPLVSGNSVAELRNDERIKKGQEDVRDNEGSNELFDVLVSFERPLSLAEVQRVLLARSEGSVPISALYLEDGISIVGGENVAAVFEENSASGITGAKIRCAGYLMSELQNDSLVLAVEIVDNNDPDQITPIITNVTGTSDLSNADSGSQTVSSEPISSSASIDNSFESIADSVSSSNTSDDVSNTGNGENENSTSNNNIESSSAESSSSTESSVLVETVPDPVENHIYAIDEGYSPAIGEGTADSEMSVPLNVLIGLGDARLPFNPVRFYYQTENINAKQAYFLNDNTLYVRTDSDIRLYTVKSGTVNLTASMECPDTKVFWIAENGGRLLALGQDGNLYDVNADNGTINAFSLNVKNTICEIAYNEDTDILALNVFENGVYTLKTYEGGFDAGNVKTLYSSPTTFKLVAANHGAGDVSACVYFASYSENGNMLIYKVSSAEEATAVSTVQGQYEIMTNAAFTHAVFENSIMSMIFDPSTFGLIRLSDSNVQFGVSRHSFYSEGSYYTIADGDKNLSGSISVIAKFDFKRSFSQNYMAAAENGTVRIVNGIYTNRAINDYLSFETPVENASEDMRLAVNAAVGIQNALAERLCAQYGITERTKATDLISICFTENAAKELKLRCAIDESKEEGETFEYAAGVNSINLSDSVLVISEETETDAVGTLYVNAGTFGGKTAYYSYAVKLQKNEEGYKADAIIE